MKVQLNLIVLFLTCSPLLLMSQTKPFVPTEFVVPETLETPHFRARMLTVNDVVKDYDAVMSSRDHLQGVFGPGSTWPTSDLTFEQDLIDLGWHQKEFQTRRSFAYTIVTPDEEQVIGCLYFYPSVNPKFDAKIIMWVRASVVESGMDEILEKSVKQWVKDFWPFKMPAYPGRGLSWEDWYKVD